MVQLTVAASSDIGQVRARNEDAFIVDDILGLYAIADGMGGHQAGDVASRLALDTIRSALTKSVTDDVGEALRQAVLQANDRVFQESIARGHIQGMGTTVTAAWWRPEAGALRLGHVGDSRCYRWRGGQLVRLTHDHSWVQAQIDLGLIGEAEAARHPMRNVVTRSIGFEQDIDVDIVEAHVEPGDVYLLATDGLTGKIPDAELPEFLAHAAGDDGLQPVLDRLIAEANGRGGEDNITVLLIQVNN